MLQTGPPGAAIILAAGASLRMKRPKALLPFGKGLTFIGHLARVFHTWGGCSQIVAVVNAEIGAECLALPGLNEICRLVLNPEPEKGRLGSIKLGLQALNPVPWCFIHNVDNPFVSPGLLDALCLGLEGYDVVGPRYQGRSGHPVLLGPHAIRTVLETPGQDQPLSEILKNLNIGWVEVPYNEVLVNINNRTDYERFGETRTEKHPPVSG